MMDGWMGRTLVGRVVGGFLGGFFELVDEGNHLTEVLLQDHLQGVVLAMKRGVNRYMD